MKSNHFICLAAIGCLVSIGCEDAAKPTPTPDPKVIQDQVAEMGNRIEQSAKEGGKSVETVDPEKFSQETGTQTSSGTDEK